jgi:hypothetical protein
MLNSIRYIFFIILILFLSISTKSTLAQADPNKLTIVNVESESFPNINVSIRVAAANNVPVRGLANSQFVITENGETKAFQGFSEEDDRQGVRIYFVVDAGYRVSAEVANGPFISRARGFIQDFVNESMIPNVDEINITAVQGDRVYNPIISRSGNRENILSAIESYQPPPAPPRIPNELGTPEIPPGSLSNPLAYIQTLLETEVAVDTGGRAQAIVLISPGLEGFSTINPGELSNEARLAGVPIFSVFTNPNLAGDQRESLNELVGDSGGVFVDSVNAEQIYNGLANLRHLYQLTYRSSINNSNPQRIEVTIESNEEVADEFEFSIPDIAAPEVTFILPEANESITRSPITGATGSDFLEPGEYLVEVEVAFPDNYERRLERPNLLADGVEVGQMTLDSGSTYGFSWDISEYSSSDNVNLEVRVTDELGLVGTSSRIVPLIVINIDGTTTPGPTPTITPTPTPTTNGSNGCTLPGPLCQILEFIGANVASVVAMCIATFALIFAVVVWLNRGQVAEAGKGAGRAFTSFVERVTSRRVQSTPKAYLVVLEGDVNVGRSLEIYGDTPIGRSKQYAELLFQQNDEQSPISRLHCTIVDEESHFTLRDEDSANGTYLNSVRLEPLVAEELHDGDEIELSQVVTGTPPVR